MVTRTVPISFFRVLAPLAHFQAHCLVTRVPFVDVLSFRALSIALRCRLMQKPPFISLFHLLELVKRDPELAAIHKSTCVYTTTDTEMGRSSSQPRLFPRL